MEGRIMGVNILKIFEPDQIEDSIYDIDLCNLLSQGFVNIIIDLDNTMAPWDQDMVLPELNQWIISTKEMGFEICILSNSKNKRIRHFASGLGVFAAPKRGKPLLRAFKSAISILEGNHHNTLVIGDQIFTDILGGNRMNLYTILVNPISSKEFFMTKLSRLLEKFILGRR
jgi:HAD superfamily phosphatase (TIGR01668 family)